MNQARLITKVFGRMRRPWLARAFRSLQRVSQETHRKSNLVTKAMRRMTLQDLSRAWRAWLAVVHDAHMSDLVNGYDARVNDLVERYDDGRRSTGYRIVARCCNRLLHGQTAVAWASWKAHVAHAQKQASDRAWARLAGVRHMRRRQLRKAWNLWLVVNHSVAVGSAAFKRAIGKMLKR